MRLIFTSGSREGQAIDIDGSQLTIGRVAENDVQVADAKVSGRHAVIERDADGRVVLRDLGSRNGTYVDGERLAGPRVLVGGERLRLGDEQLRVEAPAASDGSPRRPAGRFGRRQAGLAIAAVVLILIGLAQILLPGVAEDSLRSDLAKYGPVRRVDIHAVPAVKLLVRRADRVEVRMDSYRSEPGGHGSLADFLSRTRNTKELDARVGTLETGLLTLHDTHLQKDGDDLVAQARLTQRDLSTALPEFVRIRPVSASQNGIVVRATASVLGQSGRVNVRIQADEGRVVVQPDGLPFGSLARVNVFNDKRVYVERLGARLRGDNYLITARGRLR
jgi:hypothetical protein